MNSFTAKRDRSFWKTAGLLSMGLLSGCAGLASNSTTTAIPTTAMSTGPQVNAATAASESRPTQLRADSGASESLPSQLRDGHSASRSISDSTTSVKPVSYVEPVAQQVGPANNSTAGGSKAIEATSVGFVRGRGKRDEFYESNYCGAGCGGTVVESGECGSCGAECGPASGAPYRDAQEYIFDGGDTEPAVAVRKDWSAVGIDPTDTIAYYETMGGEVCIIPSNRVPIYAPRFGSIRQITGAHLSEMAVGTQRVLAPVGPHRFDDTNLIQRFVAPVAPQGEQQVRLVDAFQENKAGVPIEQILPPLRMSEARVPFENIDFFRTGQVVDEDIAVLGKILQGALTWYVPESLAVEIDNQSVGITRDTTLAQEVYVYETPDKCALRICKAASHTIADSGDIVNFTIRFDNTGVKAIRKAVIMDSLSPRLEYIEGSQQCSVDASFSAIPNEIGSSMLRWEISSEIESTTGGVISFDCRVR